AREALFLGSPHQSPLPLALLLRWAGVERIAAVSHEHAGSLLDVRIKGDPHHDEGERSLAGAAALGFARPLDARLAVDVAAGDVTDLADLGNGGAYVVLHPGASTPARTLAAARWRDVAAPLTGGGRKVVVTGSEEEARLTAFVAGYAPDVIDLGGRTDMPGLARVLAGAEAVLTGNTGPLHLAA